MRRCPFICIVVLAELFFGCASKASALHLICDGYMPIQERDTNNNVLVTYTRGPDASGTLSRAGGIGGLLARTDTNGTTYYHSDGNGNITALMDGNENIAARYLYSPFGKLLGQWGPLANVNEMQFSSMQRHSNSGLSLYAFRVYDSNLQRWLNQDPIGEKGGRNLYAFVSNDPINNVDAFGLFVSANANDALAVAGVYVPTYVSPSDPIAVANSYVGSLAYNSIFGNPLDLTVPEIWAGPGERPNKCNKFIGDCISSCPNRPKPLINGRFPTASQWSDPNVTIPGYGPPHNGIQPGDVITDGIHLGFMNYDGNYVEASSYGLVKSLDPNNNNAGWHPGIGRTPAQ